MTIPFFYFFTAAEIHSKNSKMCVFIFVTCHHVHFLLRCWGGAHDLIDRREWDVCVQVQAQHEIMNLVMRLDVMQRKKQLSRLQ